MGAFNRGLSQTLFFSIFILVLSLFIFCQTGYAANFNPATTQDLIDDITTANSNGEDDVINLSTTYTITGTETGVPFAGTGNNGLPVILPDNGHSITINGNGYTIQRDSLTCTGSDKFRIFEVASDAHLILNGVRVSNGCEDDGGGIYNAGTLDFDNFNNHNYVNGNKAENDGGGIYNTGTVNFNNSNNSSYYTFIDSNTAEVDGGGIYNTGTLNFDNVNNNYHRYTYIRYNVANTGHGGGIYNDGNLNITGNSQNYYTYIYIEYNTASMGNGGGIYNAQQGVISYGNSTSRRLYFYINYNTASVGDGGGIYNNGTIDANYNADSSTNSSTDNYFYLYYNRANMGNGGGIYNNSIINVVFESNNENNYSYNYFYVYDNYASLGDGGGIYNAGTIDIDYNQTINNYQTYNYFRVRSNRASAGNGGGIYNADTGVLDVDYNNSNNTSSNYDYNYFYVYSNTGYMDGGGIYNDGDLDITFTNLNNTNSYNYVYVYSNTASTGNGGGIFNSGSFDTVQNSFNNERDYIQIYSNQANTGDGGGIFNNPEGTLTIVDARIYSNYAYSGSGGGVLNDALGNASVAYSTIYNNTATGGVSGGGVKNLGTMDIFNTTISGNNATNSSGGGIENTGDLALTHVTIANNTANTSGGGINNNGGTVNVKNTLVADNTSPGGLDNCDGALNSLGGNVSDDTSCSFAIQNFDASTMLGNLTNNGGNTQTHALLPVVPNTAIDAISLANCTDQEVPEGDVVDDQRRSVRPVNFSCDSGAYEYAPYISVFIQKITAVPDGTDFDFTSTTLSTQSDCYLSYGQNLVQDDFTLKNGEYLQCNRVPGGGEHVYTVKELIPANQSLNIYCTDLPDGSVIDNDAGELSFSFVNEEADVNCLFVNTLAFELVKVEDATLEQCPLGGVIIHTGLDKNGNGVLDVPDEADQSFEVCNEEGPPGEEGEQGPPGPEGPEGPPGEDGETPLFDIVPVEPGSEQCPSGGIIINTGNDTNGNGILDAGEIIASQIICNEDENSGGNIGTGNSSNGDSGGNGCALSAGPSAGGSLVNLAVMLLPILFIAITAFRRRKV